MDQGRSLLPERWKQVVQGASKSAAMVISPRNRPWRRDAGGLGLNGNQFGDGEPSPGDHHRLTGLHLPEAGGKLGFLAFGARSPGGGFACVVWAWLKAPMARRWT